MQQPRARALLSFTTAAWLLGGCDSPGGGATESASDSGASATTAAESTGCGAPPESPACATDFDVDPRVTACAQRSEDACKGPIDPDEGADRCAWITARRSPLDATACEDASEVGLCAALEYLGDGCAMQRTCGGDVPGQVYWRVTQECELEAFRESFCGYRPIAWKTCLWSQNVEEGCAQPYPDEGPGVCACAC